MTRVRTTHLVWWRLHRLLTTMLTLVGMAILFTAGCDPATAVLPDEENGYGSEDGEFDEEDIESQEFAITGPGLPTGCGGNEFFANMGAPDGHQILWDQSNVPHFMVYYYTPLSLGGADLCWLSFHGTMDTSGYDGGSNNWDAVYQNGRIEILIPMSLRVKYLWQSPTQFRNRFYLWSYWEF